MSSRLASQAQDKGTTAAGPHEHLGSCISTHEGEEAAVEIEREHKSHLERCVAQGNAREHNGHMYIQNQYNGHSNNPLEYSGLCNQKVDFVEALEFDQMDDRYFGILAAILAPATGCPESWSISGGATHNTWTRIMAFCGSKGRLDLLNRL